MNTPTQLGHLFDQALSFAVDLHRDQKRKGSGAPYVSHLLSVAALVMEDRGTEEEVIAALLHDAIEDQGGVETRNRIFEEFGEEVCELVEAVTDTEGSPKPPWKDRKNRLLKQMQKAPEGALRIATADKLHNVRALVSDIKTRGEEKAWGVFQKGRDDQVWFFTSFIEIVEKRFQSPMLNELKELVKQL